MSWWKPLSEQQIPSPALLVYPDRIETNVREMLRVTGGPARLRPHIKTHKMPDVLRIQFDLGIRKFKAATIAECEMAAAAGAEDVLLAYPLIGPNIGRFLELMRRFPQTHFSALCDSEASLNATSSAAQNANTVIELLVDLDIGQHRTGVAPGHEAARLYAQIASSNWLRPGGLHAYDGHVSQPDLATRTQNCNTAFDQVLATRRQLQEQGIAVPKIVAGGTPTFGIHAAEHDVECSPGTCVLWDLSYGSSHPDLHFVPAAVVMSRVISRPIPKRVTCDLGHKAIASENSHPRVQFFGLEDAQFVSHSEEHLVFESDRADTLKVGDVLYGIPWHICPTVALHNEAVVIRDGTATERWPVTARNRIITV